MQSDLNIFR